MSSVDVTRLKISHNVVILEEPLKVLLKDTISETIAELIDDNIQARFGCSCLPTTIKDLNKVITNLGNFVDPEGRVQTVFRVSGFPTTILLGPRGQERGRKEGQLDGPEDALLTQARTLANEARRDER